VWDVRKGALAMQRLEGHDMPVTSVAFSPDGTKVASSSGDTVRMWDAQTGKPVMMPLEGHTKSVTSVTFSPDGTRIVSCSNDQTIRVWDAQTGQPAIQPLEGHSDYISSVAFSPDGTRIVSGSDDGTIRVWDVQADVYPVQSLRDRASRDILRSSKLPGRQRAWVVGPQDEYLLWVPPEYRFFVDHAPPSRCVLVIGRGRVTVDLSRSIHGTEWVKCFVPRL
jgi:WD40 repeat protein